MKDLLQIILFFFLKRVEGIGIITREEAINWGLSGPMLRASGVQWDLRKVDHYECYDELDWKIQWQKEGDSLARYLVRIGEMKESIKIIQQALKAIPGGPFENLEARRLSQGKNSEWNLFEYQFISKKPSPTFKLPKQEHYVRVEAPKGELGVFLIGDDSVFPWRFKIRSPGVTVGVLVLVWLERKISAAIQQRIGPEYAGPLGIIQALADGIKLFLKEDIVPAQGDVWLFNIGPILVLIPVFLSYLVIPFEYNVILANFSIGVFFWIAVSSVVPLGLLMAGYGSNNKYSFLGGLRAAAQSISYEIPLALSVLSIALRVIR
ncbi:hypothetical protein Mapa_017964 [Marchantia paleacea]|nr:hypothetical protein Mapa_017964 [Marchantia paleacea]